MTAPSLARLRELMEQWRIESVLSDRRTATTLRRCADDLAALLADTQEPEPQENQHGAADVRSDSVRRDFSDRPDSGAVDGSIHQRQVAAEGRAPEDEQPRVDDWLLQKVRAALNEARITISVDHPARIQVEDAMADIDYYRLAAAPRQAQEPAK